MAAIIHSDGRVEIIRDVVQPGDPRLADARKPTGHASTHVDAGSDEITTPLDPRAYPITVGTLAARPSAATFGTGLYWTTDEHILYRSDGSSWTKLAVADYADLTGIPSTFAPSAHASAHADGGSDEITTKLDPRAYAVVLDLLVNRPGGTIGNAGRLFYATDSKVISINGTGGGWEDAAAAAVHASAHAHNGSDPLTAANEVWSEVTVFTNSWVNFDSLRLARYHKSPDGIVRLGGVIKNGTLGASAFTLPSGYRPTSYADSSTGLVFPTLVNGAFGYVEVRSDGKVYPNGGSNAYVFLDSVQFRAA